MTAPGTAEPAELQVLTWADRYGLRADADVATTLAAARPWGVARMLYPDAPGRVLVLAAQWLAVNFVVDDRLDAEDDPARCSAAAASVMAALDLSDPPAETATDPLGGALADLWARTVAGRSAGWCERFCADFAGWLDSYAVEAASRAAGRMPAIGEYLRHRLHSSGMQVFTGLVELAAGVDLPRATRDGPRMAELRACTATSMGVLNDIYSVAKESAAGEIHNAVCVLMATMGAAPADARAATEEILRDIRARFDELAADTVADSAAADEARCVAGYRALMAGALECCTLLDRYDGGDPR